VKSSAGTVRKGQRVTLSGEFTPADGNDSVAIYVKKPGSSTWSYLTTRSAWLIDADRDDDDDDEDARESDDTQAAVAKWSYRYSLKTKGTYQFQVRFAGDTDTAASTSGTLQVRVR